MLILLEWWFDFALKKVSLLTINLTHMIAFLWQITP